MYSLPHYVGIIPFCGSISAHSPMFDYSRRKQKYADKIINSSVLLEIFGIM